jgi:hypothetical protein
MSNSSGLSPGASFSGVGFSSNVFGIRRDPASPEFRLAMTALMKFEASVGVVPKAGAPNHDSPVLNDFLAVVSNLLDTGCGGAEERTAARVGFARFGSMTEQWRASPECGSFWLASVEKVKLRHETC